LSGSPEIEQSCCAPQKKNRTATFLPGGFIAALLNQRIDGDADLDIDRK
jgi:hypothetical protein